MTLLLDAFVDPPSGFVERINRSIYRRLFALDVVTSWWHVPGLVLRELLRLIAALGDTNKEPHQ